MAVRASFFSGSPVCHSTIRVEHSRLQSAPISYAFSSELAAPNKKIATKLKFARCRSRRQHCSARASYGSPGSTGALTPELKQALDTFISSHKVVLFMKGTKDFPQWT
ncbi:hypothetical protein SUGI_0107770 [Cryptomeria japonica]|nr:hypothetical protein SUGI_0107770 [Cryptomeria japonica]